jgi:hypothetical protein
MLASEPLLHQLAFGFFEKHGRIVLVVLWLKLICTN